MQTKKCRTCGEIKKNIDFVEGLKTCKSCFHIQYRCSKCGEVKSLDQFGKDKNRANGHFTICKLCRRKKKICKICGKSFIGRQNNCPECLDKFQICSLCKEIKPLSDYYKDERRPNGKQSKCKHCFNKLRKGNTYGLNMKEVDELFAFWDNKCAICGSTEKLCIDHNHNLPKGHPEYVRGILCTQCNTAIGMMKDNPEILRKAADFCEMTTEENV